MKKTYTLTDEAMAAFLTTDAFKSLEEDQADYLGEFLMDAFGGANEVDIKVLQSRLERLIEPLHTMDKPGLSAEILKALGVRNPKHKSKIIAGWSDELVETTKKFYQEFLLTAPKYRNAIPMKNWIDGFALMSIDNVSKKGVVLTDRSTGKELRFNHFEDIIDAGWVID